MLVNANFIQKEKYQSLTLEKSREQLSGYFVSFCTCVLFDFLTIFPYVEKREGELAGQKVITEIKVWDFSFLYF